MDTVPEVQQQVRDGTSWFHREDELLGDNRCRRCIRAEIQSDCTVTCDRRRIAFYARWDGSIVLLILLLLLLTAKSIFIRI